MTDGMMKARLWTLAMCVSWAGLGVDSLAEDNRQVDAASARTGWVPMSFVTADDRASGITIGGEGCQWPQGIAVDQVDGDFALFLSDVGGIWRSLDSGQTWEPSNVGLLSRGANGVAMDPHFPNRAVLFGSNSMGSVVNGLYLTEDKAASWKPVFLAPISGVEDRRRMLAFDPSTRDDAAGMTRVVYWSRTAEVRKENWGEREINPGLYRSQDGGHTWTRLNQTSSDTAGHSAITVHPTDGRLYAANTRGVFISDDQGETFTQVYEGAVTSIAVSRARPDSVWITLANAVIVSQDRGQTWTPMQTQGLAEPLTRRDGRVDSPRERVRFQDLEVSQSNADRMMLGSHAREWRWLRHSSHDGGLTWTTADVVRGPAFMPMNSREGMFAIHPKDPDRILSFGGDWPTVSTDGGHSFQWAGEGQNAVFVSGLFNLNPHHPGLLFLASQDYNGAVTMDHGHSWSYTDVSGLEWGGFVYGGIALSPEVLAGGLSDGGWSNPRQLMRSTDGGTTWSAVDGLHWVSDKRSAEFGMDVGLVHPSDAQVAFVGRFRTGDGGASWDAMSGCSGVIAADAQGQLYGVLAHEQTTDVVKSDDAGQTWTRISQVPGSIDDLAVMPDGSKLYLASRDRLWRLPTSMDSATVLGNPLVLIETPPTGTGRHRVATVSVDPRQPQTVYVGQRIDTQAADVGVMRSTDGGNTWENLNLTQPLDGKTLDGGREPQCVRVDPHTGELWVTTGCYGVWKYRPAGH